MRLLSIGCLFKLSSCPTSCTKELTWHVTPSKMTVKVDESLQIHFNSTTCNGREELDFNWHFNLENPLDH